MPVPNRPQYIKKLAGGVAYYGVPPGPKVTVVETSAGSCNFAGASSGCTAISTAALNNLDGAVLTEIVWSAAAPGAVSGANGNTSCNFTATSDTNLILNVTCNLKIDGVDSVLTGVVNSTHNDISEQLVITSINRDSGGSCEYPAGDTCVSSSVFSVTTTGGSGTKSYEWSVTAPAVISGSNTGATVTITTEGDTDATYTVTCEITDRKFVAFKNEEFTDSKTEEVVGIIKQHIVPNWTSGYSSGNNSTVNYTLTRPTGTNRTIVVIISKPHSSSGTTFSFSSTMGGQSPSATFNNRAGTPGVASSHTYMGIYNEAKIAAMTSDTVTATCVTAGSGSWASTGYSLINAGTYTVTNITGMSGTVTNVIGGDAIIRSIPAAGTGSTWTTLNPVKETPSKLGDNFTTGNIAGGIVDPVLSGTVSVAASGTDPSEVEYGMAIVIKPAV